MTDEEIDDMEAGWQMDRLISISVFGLEPQECMVGGHPPGCPGNIPITPYSTDIAAAWLVVEKMIANDESNRLEFEYDYGEWTVGTRYYDGDWNDRADGKTFMLAVCRYALKCCKAKEVSNDR